MSNLSDLIPAGGGQNNTDFVADGAIASGKPVILTAAGKAAEVAESPVATTGATFDLDQVTVGVQYSVAGCYDTANDKVVYILQNANYSDYFTYVVGTVTNENVTWGTVTVANSAAFENVACCYNTTEGKVVAMGKEASRPKIYVGTVSGTTITWGTTPVDAYASNGSWTDNCLQEWEGTSKVVWVGWDAGGATAGYAAVGTISGTGTGQTSSWGTQQTVISDGYNSNRYNVMCYDAAVGDQVLLAYSIAGGGDIGIYTRACPLSGTDISLTPTPVSARTISYANPYQPSIAYDPVNTKALLVYNDAVVGGDYGFSRVVSTSGSVVSYGTETDFIGSGTNTRKISQFRFGLAYAANTSNFAFCYQNYDSGGSVGMVTTVEISGTIPVWAATVDQATFNAAEIRDGNNFTVYDPDTTQAVLAIKGGSNTLQTGVYRVAGDVPTSNMTASNLLGIASGAILDTATGTINTWGSRNEVQTSLTIASDYYAQTDGTITTSDGGQLLGKALSATQINIKDYTG